MCLFTSGCPWMVKQGSPFTGPRLVKVFPNQIRFDREIGNSIWLPLWMDYMRLLWGTLLAISVNRYSVAWFPLDIRPENSGWRCVNTVLNSVLDSLLYKKNQELFLRLKEPWIFSRFSWVLWFLSSTKLEINNDLEISPSKKQFPLFLTISIKFDLNRDPHVYSPVNPLLSDHFN